jgi:AraC-like DNA-binding protein
MQLSPECQALSFGPGWTLAAEVFRWSATEPPQRRYHHFHPAAELVWFRRARAVLHVYGTARPTGSGELVYLPSMMPHDFDIERGEMEFVLLLYDPAHESRLPASLQARLGQQPLIVEPDIETAARIDMLARWLTSLGADKTIDETRRWTTSHLLDLFLTLVAESGRPITSGADMTARRDSLARLERAIALVHADPARPLTIDDAARACHLSPTYFARLFKSRMGLTFGDYLKRYRLNLAAQMVAASDLGMAEIAWRTGFGSPAHFSSRFAEHFGLAPRRYRDAARRSPLGRAGAGRQQTETSLSSV